MRSFRILCTVLGFAFVGCGDDQGHLQPLADGPPAATPDAGPVQDLATQDGLFAVSDQATVVPLAEHAICVKNGKELGKCAADLTCLVDAAPPTKGICKRTCLKDTDCTSGDRCKLDAIAGSTDGVCATPAALGQSCDSLLEGPRQCFVDGVTEKVFPFCVAGTCKLICGTENSSAQAPCLAGQVCDPTLHAAPDFGGKVKLCVNYSGPKGKFGDICETNTPCESGLTCLYSGSQVFGTCTKTCTSVGTACTGAPQGTLASCILTSAQNPSQHFCGFLCKLGNYGYPCPSKEMECSPTDNPPGSGQRSCEPKVQCTSGQSRVCPDVGECKGGQQTCAGGVYGPCQWTQGPTQEICDGKDNDCNGTDDDLLTPPLCAKQQGVCKGSTQTCGGAAGFLPCKEADYTAHAKTQSMVYQAQESLCDKQDNDCNGKVDEPASCCVPQCGGKACGAPDGCGGACQTGACPSGQTCNAGKCQCQYASCNGSCCLFGETCGTGGCCAPSCSGKACGAPDGCGGTCKTGSCPSGKTCKSGVCSCAVPCGAGCCGSGQSCYFGQCCTPSCSGQPCGAPDGCGGTCKSGPCPQNSSCYQGKCTCDDNSCNGGCCPTGYDYCRSQSSYGSTLYCSTACAPKNYGCENSGDCCSGYSCIAGLCS